MPKKQSGSRFFGLITACGKALLGGTTGAALAIFFNLVEDLVVNGGLEVVPEVVCGGGIAGAGVAFINEIVYQELKRRDLEGDPRLRRLFTSTKAISEGVDDVSFYTLIVGGRILPLIVLTLEFWDELEDQLGQEKFDVLRRALFVGVGLSSVIGILFKSFQKHMGAFFENLSVLFESISAFLNTHSLSKLLWRDLYGLEEESETVVMVVTFVCLMIAVGKALQQRNKVKKGEIRFMNPFIAFINAIHAGAVLQAAEGAIANFFATTMNTDDWLKYFLSGSAGVAAIGSVLASFLFHKGILKVKHAVAWEYFEKILEAFKFASNAFMVTLYITLPEWVYESAYSDDWIPGYIAAQGVAWLFGFNVAILEGKRELLSCVRSLPEDADATACYGLIRRATCSSVTIEELGDAPPADGSKAASAIVVAPAVSATRAPAAVDAEGGVELVNPFFLASAPGVVSPRSSAEAEV